MYTAWICYPFCYDDEEDDLKPEIVFEEPAVYAWRKITQIVFTEVKLYEQN